MAGPSKVVEKYVVNPVMRTLLRAGFAPKAFALLETTGRKSGKRRLTPIGNGLDGDTFWLVAEHAERCSYVKNLIADPRVRMKIKRRWYAGRATIVADDDGDHRRRELDRANGIIGRFDGVIFRAAASEPLTIRIDLE